MVGNEILHETSNDNVITAVNFAKSKKKKKKKKVAKYSSAKNTWAIF
jgi:hypothetical protein